MYYHSFYTVDPFKPKSIEFDVWSESQVKKLSVARIQSYVPFDALGYPVIGGLYDPRLGPLKFNSDPCATCGHLLMKCSGHYGHIELPFPVFNPIFMAIVANVLRSSCLHCHTFLLSEAEKCVRISQLKLISKGFLVEAHQLEEYLLVCLEKQLPDIVDEMVAYCSKTVTSPATNPCKNADDAWRYYVNKIFRRASTFKICFYCKKKLEKIKFRNGRLFSDAKTKTYIMPIAVRDHLRIIWKNDKELLKILIEALSESDEEFPTDVCFTGSVLVTPSNTRPVNIVNQKPVEHPKNAMYRLILQDCVQIRSILLLMNPREEEPPSQEVIDVVNAQKGETMNEKLHNAWHALQISVNSLLDANALKSYINTSVGANRIGLKQLIEKKAGIIRKNMMGKRVDFFARSVVTPDPLLNINEIGVPEAFAKRLTFPVPVTSWNVTELRKLVLNGPQNYPGANIVESDDGSVVWISGTNAASREGLAKTLFTPSIDCGGPKVVHRHLRDGDMLLINRQPSLHKPSIMAHRARVLKGEKTFRLHYANCKAYNADFDGDEINAHFPQNELARAEASEIVDAANQYLVPRDGTPLSGLIQDHVIAAFRLTSKDKFYDRLQYHQFIFQAIGFLVKDIKTLPPCMLKPKRLWTGKQVISTIIINLTPEGEVPLNLNSKTKLNFNSWPQSSVPCEYLSIEDRKFLSDTNFIVRNGELLCGVLDKNHVGSTHFGLVHSFYELYGGRYSANLLSAFSKLFTYYQQKHGFTLGVLDILVKKKPDRKRAKIAVKSQTLGLAAAKKALNIPEKENVGIEQVQKMLEVSYKKNTNFRGLIDREYKTLLDQVTNEINKTCLPVGLLQPFPENNLQLMVQSGAKGSTVNTMQISCLLGQIELEGKRPPLMISGKSLPSFKPYELSPMAGGFISSRFMTGIKPQEFFFHCMAGREGLIDTAVKTSRSGYLQRCLVKHLEGLVVNYDLTVRDSDNSVIQFLYGEDGLDILKAQLLLPTQMKFFHDNIDTFKNKKEIKRFKKRTTDLVTQQKIEIREYNQISNGKRHRESGFLKFCRDVGHEKPSIDIQKKLDGRTNEASMLCQMWQTILHDETKQAYNSVICPNPVITDFKPDSYFGSVSEVMESMIENFVAKNQPDKSFKSSRFKDVVYWKSFNSLCEPGEAVGVLAAQSVGEPSTQMTLNTFHFAGRGEMNVTLGIPRLREILMVASKRIKTPSMEIPFKTNVEKLEKKAEYLRKSLTRVVLKDVLENIYVKESLKLKGETIRTYELHLRYLPRKAYSNSTNIKPQQIIKYVGTSFAAKLHIMIKKSLKSNYSSDLVLGDATAMKGEANNDKDDGENSNSNVIANDESDEDSDIGGDGDGDATEEKLRNRRLELEYDDENDDEEQDMNDSNDVNGHDFGVDEIDQKSRNENLSDDEESDETDEENNISISKIMETTLTSGLKKGAHVAEKFGIKSIVHDDENMLWSKIVLWTSLSYKRLDLSNLLFSVAENAVIHEVSGIKRAITYRNNDGLLTLKTEGSYGIAELFKHDQLLDLNKLYSNDVHAVAQIYGIEAANRVIVREIQQVFNVYGITVDPRHLLLVADYMTFDGLYRALNRTGMDGCPSPLQQMTFESTLKFLKNATLRKLKDNLQSPSSSLIVGKESKIGSGLMSLHCK